MLLLIELMIVTDFRIGNMVSYYHPNIEGIEPLIGHVIHNEEDDIVIAEYRHVSLKSYSIGGIFLTLDWLERLGFKPTNRHKNEYFLSNLLLSGDLENKKFYYIDTNKKAHHIKYLHQLQNLYFDVQDEELFLIPNEIPMQLAS